MTMRAGISSSMMKVCTARRGGPRALPGQVFGHEGVELARVGADEQGVPGLVERGGGDGREAFRIVTRAVQRWRGAHLAHAALVVISQQRALGQDVHGVIARIVG